jgi:hypothetical protein
LAESSSEVKRPEDLDLAVEEDWYGKPLWEKKFKSWQSLIWKGCPAKAGPGGRFCVWVGTTCHYNGCPRRIFEEVAVLADNIPRPTPTPDFVGEFNTLKKQVGKVQNQLKKATNRIKELEDEKKVD